MFKDDALVNLLLVYPVRWSEGLFRPLVQIDQLEISESMNPSAEIQGTAVPPKDSRTFKCNSSNFISNHRCFISFPQIGIFVRGAVIARSILGFGPKILDSSYESFQFHQLDADWLKCSSCLSHKPPASSEPVFLLSLSLFEIRNLTIPEN